jgi:hypothetical protein
MLQHDAADPLVAVVSGTDPETKEARPGTAVGNQAHDEPFGRDGTVAQAGKQDSQGDYEANQAADPTPERDPDPLRRAEADVLGDVAESVLRNYAWAVHQAHRNWVEFAY